MSVVLLAISPSFPAARSAALIAGANAVTNRRVDGTNEGGLNIACRRNLRTCPRPARTRHRAPLARAEAALAARHRAARRRWRARLCPRTRSEEHTSELQSLMRISYAVF